MSKRSRKRTSVRSAFTAVTSMILSLGRRAGQIIRGESVPVEVVLVDHSRRRAIKKDISSTIRRLNRLLADDAPTGVVVVVQQVIPPGKHLAGCCHVVNRPERGQFAVIRLALQVGGRRLTPDELLSTLVEQYLGLAFQKSGGASVLVPIDLEPPDEGPAEPKPMALRPDPFGPQARAGHDRTSSDA